MECAVCGGKEFQTNVGKQICIECGTGNTQYVDVAIGDENDVLLSIKGCGHRLINITDKVQAEKDKKQRQKDKELEASSCWTTYEALTFVLQEWTSILVQLGASSSLPKLVLKLWAGYLSKIEVAFISSQSKHHKMAIKRPKLGLVKNKRDTELLFQEKEYVSHAQISARSKLKNNKSEIGNKSLKKIMNRVQRRYLKAKMTGRVSRAASVTSDLSAVLLAAEEHQEGLGVEDGSSGESSATSCSSRGSSVSSGEDAEDDKQPRRRMFRSHFVLRWLKNKKNMYLPDGEDELAALQTETSSGSDSDNAGNENNAGGRPSNDEENQTTPNIEGVNVSSSGGSYLNSVTSPKSTRSALSKNLSSRDVPSTPCLLSIVNGTNLASHNSNDFEQIMHNEKFPKCLSGRHSKSFGSGPDANHKCQPYAKVDSSAPNDLNRSPEILREVDSDDSGEPINGSVAACISSPINEGEQSGLTDSHEDIDFTNIVEGWSLKYSSKVQLNAGASFRQPRVNRVQEDQIYMNDENTPRQQASLTNSSSHELELQNQCYEDSFLSDPCNDSFKDPNFEPVSSCSKGVDTGNYCWLEGNLKRLDHSITKTSQKQSAHSRETAKTDIKRKRNNKQSGEEEGYSKRQKTLHSRSDLAENEFHSRHSFESGKGMIDAAKSSSARGSCLPEQTATIPYNIDDLDHVLQRLNTRPEHKQLLPNGKKKRRQAPVSKYAKIWFRVNEPLMPSFSKILALLYIACRVNREEILLLDLLRWCSSNHLPFSTAPYILPDSIVTLSRYDLDMLAQCKNVPSHCRIRRHVARLSLLMDVQALPLPRLETVSSRLLHGLCLPEDLQESVVAMGNKQRSLFPPTRLEVPGVELLVGAVIIFLLKASWGLDGVQEQQLSAEVQRVNDELERLGSGHRLFCWRAWHRHMNKVQWFNKTLDPGLVTKVEDSSPFAKHYQAERLAQYFWTHGIWRRSRTSIYGDDKQATLLDRLLQAQHLTLQDAVGEARLFQASYLPLTGRAEQYRHCWEADRGQEREEMKQVAESISSTSFESHQSEFLRNAASAVRRELISLQSPLTVTVRCRDVFALPWTLFNMHQKDRPLINGTSAIEDSDSDDGDSDREEDGEEASSLTSQSTSGADNLKSKQLKQLRNRKQRANNKKSCENLKMKNRGQNGENILQSDKVEQLLQNTVNKGATAPAIDELILSNPMEQMWLLSSFPRTRKRGVVAKHLPPSYRWLLKLIAELCCTSEQDILWHAYRLEKAVTGVDSRVDVFV